MNSVFERISQSKDTCRKCGTAFSMTEGMIHSKKIGIDGNLLACPKCNSVYKSDIENGGVVFKEDVTSEYPQAQKPIKPENPAKKWWEFWK